MRGSLARSKDRAVCYTAHLRVPEFEHEPKALNLFFLNCNLFIEFKLLMQRGFLAVSVCRRLGWATPFPGVERCRVGGLAPADPGKELNENNALIAGRVRLYVDMPFEHSCVNPPYLPIQFP